MKISQFLLTRFNSPAKYAPENLGIDEAWLAHRFLLFENFCLPSVSSQDIKDFHWILLIDERTPVQWVVRLKNIISKIPPKSTILPVAQFSESEVINEIKKNVTDDKQVILTTRLDNDDAIARSYLSTVLNVCHGLRPGQNYVVNFPNGYKLHKSGIYKTKPAVLNPFMSVMSALKDLKTAFHQPHAKMGKVGTVIEIDEHQDDSNSVMWMQVIHSKNIANRLCKTIEKIDKKNISDFSIVENWEHLLKNISASAH